MLQIRFMKKCLVLLMSIFAVFGMAAQDKIRVAVFDPVSGGNGIDAGTVIAIREIIGSTIVNTGEYSLVERSMLESVMEEQAFTNSGIVDDTQATEIGKLAGANKVVVSVITAVAGHNMLSIKMIDVETATVEKQRVKVVAPEDLLFTVEPLTASLITGTEAEAVQHNIPSPSHTEEKAGGEEINAAPGEIVLYMPPGTEVKKEEHADNPITVFFDKDLVGSGTVGDGFKIVLKGIEPGVHKVRFGAKRLGEMTSVKIDTRKYSYFEYGIRRWRYMGVQFYSVIPVRMR